MTQTLSRIVVDTEKLQRLIHGLETGDQAVERAVMELRAEVDEGWNDAPSGIVYDKGSYVHVASAPGEAPAIELGGLSTSINTRRIRPGTWALRDGVEYGVILELGSSEVMARPWLLPAVERLRQGPLASVFREVVMEIAE